MTNHQTHRARGLATLCFAIAAILGVASGGVALAGEKPTSDWVDRGDVKIRLIAAKNGVGDDRALSLGLHMRLKPGWKTYWRQPGEAGLPPELDWAGSDNLGGVDMSWPLPKWFSAGGGNSRTDKAKAILGRGGIEN